MGLKDFFIEKVNDKKDDEIYPKYTPLPEDNYDDVNVDSVTQDNLVGDVYSENNLSDFSRSIFKVSEVIESLPKEMPNDTKKKTVLSILNNFGLSVNEVVEDGENRLELLSKSFNKIKAENENVIFENESIIETKKHEIEDLESDINNRRNIVSDANSKISIEQDKIEKLISFIGKE